MKLSPVFPNVLKLVRHRDALGVLKCWPTYPSLRFPGSLSCALWPGNTSYAARVMPECIENRRSKLTKPRGRQRFAARELAPPGTYLPTSRCSRGPPEQAASEGCAGRPLLSSLSLSLQFHDLQIMNQKKYTKKKTRTKILIYDIRYTYLPNLHWRMVSGMLTCAKAERRNEELDDIESILPL